MPPPATAPLIIALCILLGNEFVTADTPRARTPAPAGAGAEAGVGAGAGAAGRGELSDTLRRQLMTNNYDYMSSETEEFPAVHELDNADTTAAPPPPPPPPPAGGRGGGGGGGGGLQPRLNDIFMPRAADPEPESEEGGEAYSDPDPGVGKKDLLYYVDDDRLKKDDHDSNQVRTDSFDANFSLEMTSPKVKYKVLKVQQAAESRRAGGGGGGGGGGTRRFLQEEGEEGVVIINLGNEPFPEFRLPSARRQYMAGEGPDGDEGEGEGPDTDELEIAPLSELSEEMVRGFGDK